MPEKLAVVEQKTVPFYDDELIAVRGEDGNIYVSVRHLCVAVGVARQTQVRKIKAHQVLSKGYTGGIIMIPPGARGGGGRQQAGLLRVDLVPLWLSGIEESKVKEDVRDKLEKFQEEAARVLWEAFQEGRLTADPTFTELVETDSPAAQAYKTFQALTKLARSQLILEGHIADHERRLEQIESTLGDPGRHVTPDQASQISQAVKTVAMFLSKTSGTNQYGSVYGELYRKYGITSYKMLPESKFDEAMAWLTEWHEQLTHDVPF